MTFDEWLETRPYSKWEAFKNRNTSQVMWMRDAWEASKAEERERCAKIAELYSGIKDSQVQATARVIAEQIRKGE